MNQYPLWKYLLVLVVLVGGTLYALPNLYGDNPVVQISGSDKATLTAANRERIEKVLSGEKAAPISSSMEGDSLILRFKDTDTQLKAYGLVRDTLGYNYSVVMNLAPATPEWLKNINALPMYLGLDLRGGVHFLIEVDMETALNSAVERYVGDLRSLLRSDKIRYRTIKRTGQQIDIKFAKVEIRDQARDRIHQEYRDLVLKGSDRDGVFYLVVKMGEQEQRELKKFALKQNITTLRNRVNELGVAEPVVQQQGDNRIVVQLPGIQDPAAAKGILSATATLEYRMVDEKHDLQTALQGRVPPASKIYYERNGQPILLYKRVIVTGDQVVDAASGFDSQTGSPMVSVTLDGKGAKKMGQNTRDNVGKRMAVVFIERKTDTRRVDGEIKKTSRLVEEVISVAVIRDSFSKRFQTTGLDSADESRNLALLLRAGALAAPVEIVEERTVGPSLGQDNIDQGFRSVIIGFMLVLVFMFMYYRGFGMVANLALALNLVIIVAVLSLLQATLTLPGIAGIVLTVGMAVDANVLIFERIREELRSGNTPQASISAGYSKAFLTIADANVTTLIAAVVLFAFGTGSIKGFAITLSIGILTSMFTAIVGTRAVVNLAWGGRRLSKLSI
ncbi:MAG: protein translocase subunit SecD [Gammaproteobacteria bacterium]|nr:protein translocase subunit SecD [Gammaproteobacteria bacterium]